MSGALKVRELKPCEYSLWDDFVDRSPQGSIYNKSWWLNTVSGDFRILVCEGGSGIVGGIALPHIYGKFYRNPRLTPSLGILLGPFSDTAHVNRLTKEFNIISLLIEGLPDFVLFDYVFSENFSNALPFRWERFRFDMEFAYVMKNLEDLDQVYQGFKPAVKEKIRKAARSGIKVLDCFSVRDFYALDQQTYSRQNIYIEYTEEFLENLDCVLKERGSRKILFAVDAQNHILGANYLAYDRKSAHGVAMCSSEEGRKAGVPSLLVWEAIKFASTVSKEINFEGSSIKSVESFLRGFGAELKPRFRISRCPAVIRVLLEILKRRKGLWQRWMQRHFR